MKAFSRAAAKQKGSSGNDFLEAILRERPDLQGQMAYFPEQGGFAHTVIIGDEVFKGPKTKADVAEFDAEPDVLKQLEGKGLPVPVVTCVGKEHYFYCMMRTPGVELQSFYMELSADQEQALAEELVNFIINMALALPTQDGKYAVHADPHESNIFIDPETKKLTGIIDFGIVRYWHKDEMGYLGEWNFLERRIAQEYERRKSELPDLALPEPVMPPRRGLLPRLKGGKV